MSQVLSLDHIHRLNFWLTVLWNCCPIDVLFAGSGLVCEIIDIFSILVFLLDFLKIRVIAQSICILASQELIYSLSILISFQQIHWILCSISPIHSSIVIDGSGVVLNWCWLYYYGRHRRSWICISIDSISWSIDTRITIGSTLVDVAIVIDGSIVILFEVNIVGLLHVRVACIDGLDDEVQAGE